MSLIASHSGSWKPPGQAGSRLSGAYPDGLALCWLDTIWTDSAGWT